MSESLDWLLPGHQAGPAEVMPRIQFICAQVPDLFSALFLLSATHQGLPREILAAAVKQCRSDLDDLSREDLTGLLTAVMNGGRDGFEAVLRARRKAERRKGGLGAWVKD